MREGILLTLTLSTNPKVGQASRLPSASASASVPVHGPNVPPFLEVRALHEPGKHATCNSQHSMNARTAKPWALNVVGRPSFGCWLLNVSFWFWGSMNEPAPWRRPGGTSRRDRCNSFACHRLYANSEKDFVSRKQKSAIFAIFLPQTRLRFATARQVDAGSLKVGRVTPCAPLEKCHVTARTE